MCGRRYRHAAPPGAWTYCPQIRYKDMLHIDLCIYGLFISTYIAQIAYCTSNILSGLSTQTQTQKHISKKNKSFSKEFKQNNIVTVCRGGAAAERVQFTLCPVFYLL